MSPVIGGLMTSIPFYSFLEVAHIHLSCSGGVNKYYIPDKELCGKCVRIECPEHKYPLATW